MSLSIESVKTWKYHLVTKAVLDMLVAFREDVDSLENPRAELERLRKERARLMELQNQLKEMHDIVERVSNNDENIVNFSIKLIYFF